MMTVRLINARSMGSYPFDGNLTGWTFGPGAVEAASRPAFLRGRNKSNDENAERNRYNWKRDDHEKFEHVVSFRGLT